MPAHRHDEAQPLNDSRNFQRAGAHDQRPRKSHLLQHFRAGDSICPLYDDAVGDELEQELNRRLFTRAERAAGYYVRFNLAGLLRGTAKERAEFYHYAITDGWMCRNEGARL